MTRLKLMIRDSCISKSDQGDQDSRRTQKNVNQVPRPGMENRHTTKNLKQPKNTHKKSK